MTQTPTHSRAGQARAQFTVPAAAPHGDRSWDPGDSLLRVIETAFPAADIHVRGNEISADRATPPMSPSSSACSTR